MSNLNPSPSPVAGPGFPRMALALAWFGSSVGTGVLGSLLPGLSGGALLGISALELVATGAVVSNRHRRVTLGFSTIASMVVVAVATVLALVTAIFSEPNVATAVATAAVPVLGGAAATAASSLSVVGNANRLRR